MSDRSSKETPASVAVACESVYDRVQASTRRTCIGGGSTLRVCRPLDVLLQWSEEKSGTSCLTRRKSSEQGATNHLSEGAQRAILVPRTDDSLDADQACQV